MDEKSRYEQFNEITFEAYCKTAISALLSAIFSFRLKEPPSSFLTVKSPHPG